MKFKTLILGATTALLLSACGANEAEISEQAENAGLENEVSNVPFEEQEDKLTSSGSEFYRSVVPYELSPARGLSSANIVSSYNEKNLKKDCQTLVRMSSVQMSMFLEKVKLSLKR